MSLGLIYFVGDALRARCRTRLSREASLRCLDWSEAGAGGLSGHSGGVERQRLLLDATGGPSGPALAEIPPEQLPAGLAELRAAGTARSIAAIDPNALFAALTDEAHASGHHHHHHHHDGEACHHDHAEPSPQSHALARSALIASVEWADRLTVDARGLSTARALEFRRVLRSLNGGAEIVFHDEEGALVDDLTALPGESRGAPAWEMVQAGERPQEFAELGLDALVYRSRAPINGKRFAEFMARKSDGVIRAVGHFWLATRPDLVCAWSRCGTLSMTYPVGAWWASISRDRWPPGATAEIERHWAEPYGDRQQEFVLVGHGMDVAAIRDALGACALSEAELELGPQGWARLPDPFPAWAPAPH